MSLLVLASRSTTKAWCTSFLLGRGSWCDRKDDREEESWILFRSRLMRRTIGVFLGSFRHYACPQLRGPSESASCVGPQSSFVTYVCAFPDSVSLLPLGMSMTQGGSAGRVTLSATSLAHLNASLCHQHQPLSQLHRLAVLAKSSLRKPTEP